jgi:hypothetical protein
MTTTSTFQRTPLVISAGSLVAGPVHATFREGDRESLLHSYLVLVRQLRGQPRTPTITLRSADITAIADHLGASEERVLDDLLDRMGATRAQRKALAAMFAVGALTIVATGSIALEVAPVGVFAGDTGGAAPVVEVADESPTVGDAASAAIVVPAAAPSAAASAPEVEQAASEAEPSVSWPVPELAIAESGADFEMMVALLSLALADPAAAEATDGSGVADDGSVVATGQPPAPVVEGIGVADDGSTVAVAPPPAPPVEGVGVADDGSIVGVGLPPAPPTEP